MAERAASRTAPGRFDRRVHGTLRTQPGPHGRIGGRGRRAMVYALLTERADRRIFRDIE
jgi:hypothetical protein